MPTTPTSEFVKQFQFQFVNTVDFESSKDSQVQKSWTCICQKAREVPLIISKIYCRIYQKEHTLTLSCIKLLMSIPFNSQTLTFRPKKVPTLFHPPSSERFRFSFQPQKGNFLHIPKKYSKYQTVATSSVINFKVLLSKWGLLLERP